MAGMSAFDEKTGAQILRQVEFYFSDSNLPRDKFLRQCLEENEDGLVSLPLVCSFSRMRNFLGLKEAGPDKVPAETVAAVAEVLRKSSSLRISDDGEKVGRTNALVKPDEVQASVDARSVAAGPLRWTVTMEEVEAFFSQHAKVNSVRLPRHAIGRIFCGSALVELSSEDEAKKVLELKLTYDGTELEIKPKSELDEEMEKYQQQQQSSPHQKGQHSKLPFSNRNGRARNESAEASYPKGLIVAFSLQKISKVDNGVVENTEAVTMDPKEGVVSDSKEDLTTTVSDKGIEVEANQITREDIKDVLRKFGTVKYVDYTRGGTSGYLRFETSEGGQKARTAAVLAEEGGLVVKDHIATFESVEGEAEKEYWAKLRGAQDSRRRGGDFSRGSRDRFQRNKRGRSEGRQNQQNDDIEPKPESDTKTGKHMRFEEEGCEDKDERPPKQKKTGDAVPS